MKKIFKSEALPAPESDHTNQFFLAGANLETTLAKDYHIDLTHNAAFELLYTREGRTLMKQYHDLYLQLAERYHLTYILETPTWRANRDWIFRLGYKPHEAVTVNRHAVQFIRETQRGKKCNVILSGSVGPRRDDFDSGPGMSANESFLYHSEQIRTFALLDVDIITARAFNHCNEAIGVVDACRALGVPVAVSFKIDSDGNLANGESLGKAILQVDRETQHYTMYYTVHCSSLVTLERLIDCSGNWSERMHGIHIPTRIPTHMLAAIKEHFPNLKILGGCGFHFSSLDELCRLFLAE